MHQTQYITNERHYQPPFENHYPRTDITLTTQPARGANRAEGASNDSRNYGPVQKEEIVGHAFYRFYPFNDMGNIDNNPYGENK